MKKLFTGVCTALVTPFDGGGIDFDALKLLIQRQIDAGIDALCILGTTGEAATLSLQEKQEVIKFAVSEVNGKIPLIFGIGGNNPADIISLGMFARQTGANGVMVTAPYYNKCTQDGAAEYFNHIADTLKMPLVVYNVPGRTGINLKPETLALISKNKYICGIKEASGDINQIAETVRTCSVPVYCGDDGIALPCYAVGCRGIISVASNVIPESVRKLWVTRLKNLYLRYLPFYRALFCEVNPIPVKYMLSEMGLIKNELRLPLTCLRDKSIIDDYAVRKLFKRTCD